MAEVCTGDSGCSAVQHVHGCYADRGACDAPEEHRPWPRITCLAHLQVEPCSTCAAYIAAGL